jgi:hypothetical protein
MAAWSKALLKSYYFKLVKKLPAFYGTWKSIFFFTKAHHFFLSWARLIALSQPIPLRSILILSYHQHLRLPMSCFLHVFLPKSYTHFSSLPTPHMPHTSNTADIDRHHSIRRRVQIMESLVMLFSRVISSLLDVNTFLSTLFSNTRKLYSSPDVRHQVSHPYKKHSY